MKNIFYTSIALFIFLLSFPSQLFTQDWKTYAPGSGYFMIANVEQNKVIDVAGSATQVGSNVVIWSKHKGKNQQFRFIKISDGYYAVETALKKNIYLSIHNSGTTD